MDSGQTRNSSGPDPLSFEGARILRERNTKQDVNKFGATVGCPGCNAIKENKRARKPIQIVAQSDLKNVSEEIYRGAERYDRRSEVIIEDRSTRVTTAAPASKLAASTPHELRGNRLNPIRIPRKTIPEISVVTSQRQ